MVYEPMSRPPITIVMTTYFPPGPSGALRVGVAKRALQSWLKFLHYDGEIRLHVADDGSDPDHFDILKIATVSVADSYSYQDRCGVGASLNAGFKSGFERGLVGYLVDDWIALADFDLTPWADLLLADESVGMVRFSPPHPGLTGEVIAYPAGWALKLDRHNLAFATRPALYHKRMIDRYGWFTEGQNAFVVENDYNERFCSEIKCNIFAPGHQDHFAGCYEKKCDGETWPGIVLALPLIFDHVESIELGDITPA